jgi:hypothetical protein
VSALAYRRRGGGGSLAWLTLSPRTRCLAGARTGHASGEVIIQQVRAFLGVCWPGWLWLFLSLGRYSNRIDEPLLVVTVCLRLKPPPSPSSLLNWAESGRAWFLFVALSISLFSVLAERRSQVVGGGSQSSRQTCAQTHKHGRARHTPTWRCPPVMNAQDSWRLQCSQ